MTSDLKRKIEATKGRIDGLKDKRAEIDAKIRKEEADLEKLEMMDRSEQFSAIEAAAAQSGMTVEDIMAMIKNQNSGNKPDAGDGFGGNYEEE